MVLGLLVVMTGCPETVNKAEPKGMVYFTFFDTVSYIYSYKVQTNEQFGKNCEGVSEILEEYHRLFDIYHEYSGVVNLCTLNKNAGGEPMVVDEKLIDFLLYAEELYTLTGGEMNIMMGAVLRPWHDCREAAGTDPSSASIPNEDKLSEAMLERSFKSGDKVKCDYTDGKFVFVL